MIRSTKLIIAFLGLTQLVSLALCFSRNIILAPSLKDRKLQVPLALASARAEADFESPRATKDRRSVDPDVYNVSVEKASELWTVSVQDSKSADREAGVPFMDSKSKDYFVDDIQSIEVSRDGGLGMELLELAGGREDGIGITIVTGVTKGGNAEKAGIIPGDTISAVAVYETKKSNVGGLMEGTTSRTLNCECRDFENTIDALANFPGDDADLVYLDVKRIRRWPKIKVQVEYPPSQCAEGVDNVKQLELFAGENLMRALQTRRIILSDPGNPAKCDFCGSSACYVSISKGRHLLNPMGLTEEKIMQRNPDCRLSCKTTVGYNMQEGELKLRVNLSQWKSE